MPVDEVTLAPNLEAVLFTPAVGKRGRHVDAFQTYHDFYKDELHIPQRRFDAGRLPTASPPGQTFLRPGNTPAQPRGKPRFPISELYQGTGPGEHPTPGCVNLRRWREFGWYGFGPYPPRDSAPLGDAGNPRVRPPANHRSFDMQSSTRCYASHSPKPLISGASPGEWLPYGADGCDALRTKKGIYYKHTKGLPSATPMNPACPAQFQDPHPIKEPAASPP